MIVARVSGSVSSPNKSKPSPGAASELSSAVEIRMPTLDL